VVESERLDAGAFRGARVATADAVAVAGVNSMDGVRVIVDDRLIPVAPRNGLGRVVAATSA
jgi:hypothetical protein